MTGKRLIALVATALMIVGAIFVRSRIDSKDSSGTGPTSADPAVVSKGVLAITCSTELVSACQDLRAVYTSRVEITVEPAGDTLDRLAAAPFNKLSGLLPDLWITLAPFPAMLDESRQSGPVVLTTSNLAQTDPQLVLPSDRAAALLAACGAEALWRCIGDFAGTPWADIPNSKSTGTVKPGFADPAAEAVGLVTLANAASGYFSAANFSRSDWEADSGFSRWIGQISSKSRLTPTSKSPLATLITQPSALNIAATDSAEISHTERVKDPKYTALTSSPTILLQTQMASFTASDADLQTQVLESLRSSLTETYGWDAPADPGQSISAGTFIALRQLWKEIT